MPTPKYIFTANDDQLTVTLDNTSFQWENDDTSSYREASVSLYDLKKIQLFDFGKFQREFIFENIKTVGGVIPDNIDEAYDLISNLIPVASGGGTTVDTAFVTKPYSATMSVAYNPEQPNFNINLTGNLDLTITGSSNGDNGIINLYFSGTEVATLNGFEDLVINGNGAMIPVWFIHDSDGLKWDTKPQGGDIDTSNLAVQDGTILYHIATATTAGTVTSSGTNWTGTGTSISNNMIGAKITVNGKTTIIETVDSGAQTFTTVDAIPATSETFDIRCKAYQINEDGSTNEYGYLGNLIKYMEANGFYKIHQTGFLPNGNMVCDGDQFSLQGEVLLNGNGSVTSKYKIDKLYTFETLPAISEGETAYASISDGGTPIYMTAAAGGGSNICSVYWNTVMWLYK